MTFLRDQVPMYKIRPNRALLWGAVFVFIVGGLVAGYFFNEDVYTLGSSRGLLALVVTVVLCLFLVIAATAHFWFRHLWHHRPGYKRG